MHVTYNGKLWVEMEEKGAQNRGLRKQIKQIIFIN